MTKTFPTYECLFTTVIGTQFWPCYKKRTGQTRIIIWTKSGKPWVTDAFNQVPQFQVSQSWKRGFPRVLTIHVYGHSDEIICQEDGGAQKVCF